MMQEPFTEKIIQRTVVLEPHELNNNLFATLDEKIKEELSGKCVPNLGYVQPGSVQVISKTLGQYLGSHFTGNISYRLDVKVSVTKPEPGQLMTSLVTKKNDAGLLAKNYTFPYQLFGPKIPGDHENNNTIERVQKNSYVKMRFQDSVLRAPNKDNPHANYWVVCNVEEEFANDFTGEVSRNHDEGGPAWLSEVTEDKESNTTA